MNLIMADNQLLLYLLPKIGLGIIVATFIHEPHHSRQPTITIPTSKNWFGNYCCNHNNDDHGFCPKQENSGHMGKTQGGKMNTGGENDDLYMDKVQVSVCKTLQTIPTT